MRTNKVKKAHGGNMSEPIDSDLLFKNDCDKWQFNVGERKNELSCGSVVEIYAFDHWLRGRIEADSKGYFFFDPVTGVKFDRNLGGCKVRMVEPKR